MIQISVLVPQRNAAESVLRLLPVLRRALDKTRATYEVLVVDDGSESANIRLLCELAGREDSVRLVGLQPAVGLSAALSAGIAAARGNVIVAVEASDRFDSGQVRQLVRSLARADMVIGKPRRQGVNKLWHRLARVPRWLLLGLESRDPDCVFWAARAEALAGIQLARGMYRYLPTFVAMRGYRVSEIPIAVGGASRRHADGRPNPGDLLCAWWLKRRWRNYTAQEYTTGHDIAPRDNATKAA